VSTKDFDPSGHGVVSGVLLRPAVSLPVPFRRKQQEVVDPRAGVVECDVRNPLYVGNAG
jgi:hypothetical protein